MNKFNFTKANIGKILPAKKGYDSYYDVGVAGLLVIVTGNGAKTFYVYKKVHGRPERIKIGRFPDLSIEQARNRAKVLLSEIAQGNNPSEDKRKVRSTVNLGELFSLFGEKRGQYKRSWRNDISLYNRYLQPWSHKRITEIRKSDVVDMHNEISKKFGHVHQANRLRALLHTLFEFAIEHGYEGFNPCRGVKKFREGKRDRFLTKEELPRFFDTILNDPHPFICDFILVALFSGARSGNIQSLCWTEIDFDKALWNIPMSKSGEGYTIPLVEYLVDLLNERRSHADGEFIFPSDRKDSHINSPKAQWQRVCKQAGIENLRIHDLRRTLGSYMAQTGSTLLVISGALGHKIDTSSVTGIYARLDLETVRLAMERAVRAMLIHGGVIKADVIPFQKLSEM